VASENKNSEQRNFGIEAHRTKVVTGAGHHARVKGIAQPYRSKRESEMRVQNQTGKGGETAASFLRNFMRSESCRRIEAKARPKWRGVGTRETF
jgi:hypothetical protein